MYNALEIATFLENWPPGLASLSVRGIDVPLSIDEAAALGRSALRSGNRFPHVHAAGEVIDKLTLRVDRAVREFPQGAFVRLGSRSPKDSQFVRDLRGCVFGGRIALMCLTEGSERILDDLEAAIAMHYPPHIFVRPWIEIPPWTELRGFMKQRKLVGLSQYNGVAQGRGFPELQTHADRVRAAVSSFFAAFCAVSHLDNCIFDVLLVRDPAAGVGAVLLELAPFDETSDLLLFAGSESVFDGSFRLLDNQGRILTLV